MRNESSAAAKSPFGNLPTLELWIIEANLLKRKRNAEIVSLRFFHPCNIIRGVSVRLPRRRDHSDYFSLHPRTDSSPTLMEIASKETLDELQPPPAVNGQQFRTKLAAGIASLVVGGCLMGAKFYVYRLTGSSAFLSDALESIINVVASSFVLVSIVLASKPPDASHPYGHGKIEYFSVGFEGALIIGAAAGIFHKAWPQILHPKALPNLESGILISCAISAVNLILGLALIYLGKRTKSITLVADGRHLLTDVFTSGGVVAGVFLVWLTGWLWMDGTVACLVALNILFTGWRMIRHSFAGLMDASDPALLQEITRILASHRKREWIDVHQLRARRYGTHVHLDFHLILPREFTLEEGYREVKELQSIFREQYGSGADVNVHVDPCTCRECPLCGRTPCLCREKPAGRQRLWTQEVVTRGPEAPRQAEEDSKEPNR